MRSRTLPILHLTALSSLLRLPLALMVALTALTGALAVRTPLPPLTLWTVGWGVFLLTAAGSVLNQVQERASDALMRRTAGRPLACGLLSPGSGTAIGLLLASSGLAALTVGTGTATALLGLAALAWYLAVYTPLKRLSPLAVLAGTPCGAVPPLLGWVAAGGPFPAPQPMALALFMLLWQVPHYWLLALPDRAELKAAGFHVLPDLPDRQILAISERWLFGLALVALLFPALELSATPLLGGVLAGLTLAMAIAAAWHHHHDLFAAHVARKLRRLLHLYLGGILLLLLLGCLV